MSVKSVEGYLDKKTGFIGVWHKRYCVLENNKLSVYKDETKDKINNVIEISQNCEITPLATEKFYRFKVVSPEDKTYYFDAGSEENQIKWLNALFQANYPPTAVSMDDFEILSVIGRGFYGKVMLARHIPTGRLVAIKSVHKKELLEMQKVQTIMTELNILRRNKNPYIVRLLFAFQTPSKFYLVEEYAEGGDLFFHLSNRGSLPLEEVRVYIAEIALALNHLHKNGVIYRDLKPENVLFSADGHVLLADFGVSKIVEDENSTTTTICGTSEYLAPEVIQKKPYTMAVDFWQLGILMYEMIAEHTPFAEGDKAAMYRSIVTRTPSLFPIKDQAARELISALLRKNPFERPSFEELKSFRFFDGLDFAAVEARELPAPYAPPCADPDGSLGPVNFDTSLTSQRPMDSYVMPVGAHYQDFEYVASSFGRGERPPAPAVPEAIE